MVFDSYFREFVPELSQVRAARHHAMEVVRSWKLDCDDDVGLVTTELAANAVLHGQSTFTVTLRHDDALVTIEVGDSNQQMPTLHSASFSSVSGRGLTIVDRLSAHWGVVPSTDGKVVWAMVECGIAAPTSALPEAHTPAY